jgi:WD40 repeat protein
MAAHTKCPACQSLIPLAGVAAGAALVCPGCGTSLRRKPAPPPAPGTPNDGVLKLAEPLPPLVAEAAPAPRPEGGRKKKRKKKPAAPRRAPVLLLVGGGCGVLLLAVVGVGLGVWAWRSGGRGGAGATPSNYAVVDEPVPGVGPAPPDDPPKQAAPQDDKPKAPSAPAAPAAPAPLWNIRPDAPAAAPATVAADLNVPAPRTVASGGTMTSFLFAAQDGRFVLAAPAWKEFPYGKRPAELEKDPPAEPPVFDLRTGRPAGAFPWRAPVFTASRLGPDAAYLVAPDYVPGRFATHNEGTVFVWKQKEAEPVAQLQMPGPVGWLDFVAADRVALLTFTPGAAVQVWDVAKGKLTKSVALKAGQFKPPQPDGNMTVKPKFWYDPGHTAGAVSPTGRYLALGGDKGAVLIDLAEGKEVGTFPVAEVAQGAFIGGLLFSPDGARLFALGLHAQWNTAAVAPRLLPHLLVWDVATGRPLADVHLKDEPRQGTILKGRLLSGPEPGTVILIVASTQSARVIDTQSGAYVHTLPYEPVRWAGPDRLLAVKDGARAVAFDRARFRAEAGPLLAAGAARPPVVAADRTALRAVEPRPPAAWAPPPSPERPLTVSDAPAVLGDWPAAFGDTEGAVLTYVYQQVPKARHELRWQRVDLRTGKALGTHLLWPWVVKPHPLPGAGAGPPRAPPVAALTADGKRLAVRDPADAGRVDVWADDGQRLLGLGPCAGAAVDWLGWSPGGKLLVLGAGRLSAWEVPAGKGVYEVRGGYSTPVVFGPGRKWLAAAAAGAVDLLDPESGRCLARCRADAAGAAYTALALSPDGKSLAAARRGGPPAPEGKTEWTADVWDLATGKPTAIPFGAGRLELLHWSTPRHLLAASGTVEVIDLALGGVAWTVSPARGPGGGPAAGPPRLSATPDGRLWVDVPNYRPSAERPGPRLWQTQRIPGPAAEADRLVLADGREYPLASPVRVEVDVGDRARSLEVARKLAGELQQRGFTIGPKGWALRVSHAVADSGRLFVTSSRDTKGTPIPMVHFTFQLLDPEGAEVWKAEKAGHFAQQGSKYFVKSKVGMFARQQDPLASRIDYYDFGSRGMHKAIVEEILERDGANLALPAGVPKQFLKAQGVYRIVPLPGEIKLDGK